MSCAKETLKLLPKEVLASIASLSVAANAALSVLRAQKQALAVSLDIQLIPLQAKKLLLETAVGGVRESTKIIPSNLIIQCPDLGKINTMLEQSLVGPIEGAINAVFEIDRMVSLKSEVSAALQEIDTAIDFFTSLSADIADILSSA